MSAQDHPGWLAPAGLIVGPTLWAIATQAGQILPYTTCDSPWRVPAILAFAGALASLAGGWISWRATRPERRSQDSAYPASLPFVGQMGACIGPIFAYALVLQGLSALVLTGCER